MSKSRTEQIQTEKRAADVARRSKIATIHNPNLRTHPQPVGPPTPGVIGPGVGAPGLAPPVFGPGAGNTQGADTGTPAPAQSSGFSISTMLILIVLGIVAFIIYDKVIK